MSLETDLLLDRRRLKRRLFFLAHLRRAARARRGAGGAARQAALGIGRAHVARLHGQRPDHRGPQARPTRSTSWPTTTSVKALIVSIDSPGGSVAGGESLHDAIAQVAAKKPVVAVMGGLAASAGYMIAVPAARIFAHEATLTGSIGVLLETGRSPACWASSGSTRRPSSPAR